MRSLFETERLVMGWQIVECEECAGDGSGSKDIGDYVCFLCQGSGLIWVDPNGWEGGPYLAGGLDAYR